MSKKIEVSEDEIRDVAEVFCIGAGAILSRKNAIKHFLFFWKCSNSMKDRKLRKCIAILQERGEPIIAFSSGGYGYMPDDPKAAIEYCNKLYRRVKTEKDKADNIYFLLKRKYGQEVASKVDQPFLDMEVQEC